MKRTLLLSAVLLAALTFSLAISTPKPLYAVLVCCDHGGYPTTWYWEMAATCAEAQAAHRAKSLPEAEDFCRPYGVCEFSVPNCYISGAMWVADGPATYGCRYNYFGPPPCP